MVPPAVERRCYWADKKDWAAPVIPVSLLAPHESDWSAGMLQVSCSFQIWLFADMLSLNVRNHKIIHA